MLERQKRPVEETDSTTLTLAESLRYAKFQISLLFVEGPGEDLDRYRSQVDSLSKVANDLEAELSRQSTSFMRRQDYRNVSTDRIAGLLPEGSTLVEYVKYDYLELRPEERIPHYAVIAVTQGTEPVITHLGEASEVDGLVDEYRAHMLRVSDANRRPTAVDRTEYEAIGRKLYERLWAPVEAMVPERGLVFVAPDGALSMVSFSGLIDGEGNYLVERFPIHHLSSGRDVIRLKDDPEPGIGLFALGDPDYDAASEETGTEVAAYVTRNVRSGCGELRDLEVSRLPGTRSEVEEIVMRWEKSTGEPVVAYYGKEAGEERFKTEAPGKRAVHLATHGYFLEGRCQPGPAEHDFDSDAGFTGENPLLLSGLLFAGVKRNGEAADSLGKEDGILTAYEVTAMDLSGTEMVVLSACETGLGRVEEGEGVYGLRRAFQMAGARTVISALWPVPDMATADMIGQLYDRQNESIPETMRRLQLDKINELRRGGQSDHPFTWAGFMAMGDWR
jgi:CHAT domain-containing protein